MKKILLALVIGAMFSAVGFAIATPSMFRSSPLKWTELPEVNVNNTTKVYYANGAYVTRFYDGVATCYIYSTPSVTSLSCAK